MKTLFDTYFRNLKLLILGGTLCLALLSCKDGWLEAKRDISLIVPSSLADMHDLLRNTRVFMYDGLGTGIVSADDHYMDDATLSAILQRIRKSYLWQADMFQGEQNISDWDKSYQQVAYSNLILGGLEKIDRNINNFKEWNGIKGGALFFRGKAFFNLAQLFAQPWPSNQVGQNLLGIPLPLQADVSGIVTRATLVETYAQIEKDLKDAAALLDPFPEQPTDASKKVAWAMLSRCYLAIGRFSESLAYADSCLDQPYSIMDLNNLDSTKTYPFARFNPEVWLHSLSEPNHVAFFSANADTNLVASYEKNDLRKAFYFQENKPGILGFRGNYSGSSDTFSGIAADEILLIRAECLARLGQGADALSTLDGLLIHRYKTGTYQKAVVQNDQEALELILRERRKELLIRGLRWTDLRRLNQETAWQTVLKRNTINGHYNLQPNDPGYTLPIPDYVIQLSEIEQNKY